MSVFVEVAGFLSGVIAGYAEKKQWSKCKIFLVMFSSFFLLFMFYVVLFPSDKGIWIGMSLAAAFGCWVGMVCVILMCYNDWRRNVRGRNHE